MIKKVISVCVAVFVAVDALACTSAIVGASASGTGRPILWKHRDNKSKNGVLYCDTYKYAFIGVTGSKSVPVKSVIGGTNVKGFSIIDTSDKMLIQDNDIREHGKKNSSLMYQALGECATVDDFEALLNSIPKPRRLGANFGVIDANGGAAFFEVGDQDYNRVDVPADGWYVETNFPASEGRKYINNSKARYDTANMLMKSHQGEFSPEFFISTMGRSTYNSVIGKDLRDIATDGLGMWNNDCILRYSSLCDICIEGVGPDDRENSSLMWLTCGFPAAAFAVPLWVAAGDAIPECLRLNESGSCKLFNWSQKLKDAMFPKLYRGGYIDFNVLDKVAESVAEIEEVIFSEGKALDRKFRKRMRPGEVESFNESIDERYREFRKATSEIVQ